MADTAVAAGDFGAAAAALHEFVTRVRRHIVSLMRLVEICVDGGLEATMYSAQAQLADAYLDAGRGLEARIISEDLVAREPWDAANIALVRRALAMLGEPDPDAVIADRLSGDSPFMATDKLDLNEGVVFDDPVEIPEPAAAVADGEIDLAAALDSASADKQARGKGKKGQKPADAIIEAGRAQDDSLAAEQLRLGLTYRDMGMTDDAIQALELASRSSRLRFEAASTLGRLYVERGDRGKALESWVMPEPVYAQPAEAPAPTLDAGRGLLYELASVLEDLGETSRALAVFGEIQADQRGFRDVTARIERLSRAAQVRG